MLDYRSMLGLIEFISITLTHKLTSIVEAFHINLITSTDCSSGGERDFEVIEGLLQPFSSEDDLVSHTTYIACDNFIHDCWAP